VRHFDAAAAANAAAAALGSSTADGLSRLPALFQVCNGM